MRLVKGYMNDAGYDVVLDRDITLKPGINVVNLNMQITVVKGEYAYLCARTSSAKEGLIVAQCPIDADYSGDIHAIVYNLTNEAKLYCKGEAFCQLVYCTMGHCYEQFTCKKEGTRSISCFGGTGK